MAIYRAQNTIDEDFKSCSACGWSADYNGNGKNHQPVKEFNS